MADRLLELSPSHYNIRGSFKIGGVVDIGTQASLVRKADGRFVLLDAYEPDPTVLDRVLALTDGGAAIDAILNLHPFHTVHVKAIAARFPHAKLYGTARHHRKAPDLPWQSATTDSAQCHDEFAADFDFFVPDGVDFISANESVHFSSVLALHRDSGVLYVDDTLSFYRIPMVDKMVGKPGHLRLHPTLGKALQRRAGAATAFRAWAQELASRCATATAICTAHVGVLKAGEGPPLDQRILSALDAAASTLDRHEAKWG